MAVQEARAKRVYGGRSGRVLQGRAGREGEEDTITFGRVIHFTKDKLMVDARISYGNSGGGVFDKKGRLLGIIHHIEPSRPRRPGDWINVAIPAKTIKAFLEE